MKKAILSVLVLVFVFASGVGAHAEMQAKKSAPKKVMVVKKKVMKKVVKKVVVKKVVKQPAKAMKKDPFVRSLKDLPSPLPERPEPTMKQKLEMMKPETQSAVPAPTATTSSPAAQATVIMYSGSAFSPSTITVKLDTTVTFKNQGTGSMWVASAMHPTHQLYPEFDQNTSSGPGSEYSFTFTKKGSWGFHDHLNPSAWGRIVVEE